MEIKEKKVVTEWELKSDVFNFSDKTNFIDLSLSDVCQRPQFPEYDFNARVYSEDFGQVEIKISANGVEHCENLAKLFDVIGNNWRELK